MLEVDNASLDRAILAAQVTNFAIVLVVGVARGRLATCPGVKVGESARAVAVSRNWRLVDVEREGTALGRKILDVDAPLNRRITRRSAANDRASNSVLLLLGKIGNVASTREVLGDCRSNAGLSRGDDRNRSGE